MHNTWLPFFFHPLKPLGARIALALELCRGPDEEQGTVLEVAVIRMRSRARS